MSTGLAIPVGVNKKGGAKLVSGDENNTKIIRLSLGDDSNENAFQQNIGLGISMIFGVSDETIRASIIRRLYDVFRKFEAQKRFTLRRETVRWTKGDDQDLVLEFRYLCLESDEEKLFRQNYSVATGSTTGTVGA